jgi:hypothetical protein
VLLLVAHPEEHVAVPCFAIQSPVDYVVVVAVVGWLLVEEAVVPAPEGHHCSEMERR